MTLYNRTIIMYAITRYSNHISLALNANTKIYMSAMCICNDQEVN